MFELLFNEFLISSLQITTSDLSDPFPVFLITFGMDIFMAMCTLYLKIRRSYLKLLKMCLLFHLLVLDFDSLKL